MITARKILFALVVLMLLGGGWYFFSPHTTKLNNAVPVGGAATTTPATAPVKTMLPPRTPPAGFTEYRNEQYNFSLFYPSELAVKVTDNGGKASTIVFQNPALGQGFQMFIVPYGQPQVTDAQFARDEPSGVRKNVQQSEVGGATAATFDSIDFTLGATHEVWFVHGNYLYEVTTLQPTGSWLEELLKSWLFLS